MAALRAQNAIRMATAAMQRSSERLSTGKRINSPADDPAGFAVASAMSAQIAGMSMATRNAQDGISLAQTAEGSLQNVTNMAQRLRELAVNAASGTYSGTDRANMDAEARQLAAQMVNILRDTQFNGNSLFDTSAAGTGSGTAGTPGFGTTRILQIGAGSGDVMDFTIENIDMSWASTVSLASVTDAQAMQTTMDDFLKKVTTVRSGIGAKQSRLESSISMLGTSSLNLAEARSRIEDVDYGAETMALAKAQIMLQASTAMLAQANQMQKMVLNLIS